jgi:hypothetical protein
VRGSHARAAVGADLDAVVHSQPRERLAEHIRREEPSGIVDVLRGRSNAGARDVARDWVHQPPLVDQVHIDLPLVAGPVVISPVASIV